MSDLTDAQFAAYVDRILECRKAEDTAKEDTKQAYADLKDAGGDKTEAGLLVRALRMEEKDAGKAKAREDMLEEARLRYRRGKASHVRAREASQSYAEAKGRDAGSSSGRTAEFDSANAGSNPAPVTSGELTDTQEQPETTPAIQTPANAPRLAADDEAAQASPTSSAPLSHPQPNLLPGAVKAGDVPPPSSPAALSEADVPAFLKTERRKTSADYRPHCRHPDNCGSSNPTGYCYQCRKAMEAASETEAA